jgi:hypothetical protein
MRCVWRDIIPSITCAVREHGWSSLTVLPARFFNYLFVLFFRGGTFDFLGHRLRYFYHETDAWCLCVNYALTM